MELAVPGFLDLGDVFEVVDLADGGAGVGDGGGAAAGDVVEGLAPGDVDLFLVGAGEGLVVVDRALLAL